MIKIIKSYDTEWLATMGLTAGLLAVTLLISVLVITVQAPNSYAQTVPGIGQPYSGWVDPSTAVVDSELVLDPSCPFYSVIDNADPTDGLPLQFGVYVPTGAEADLYDYGNLYVPGTPVLGQLNPIPFANTACATGYPLYEIMFDGLYYQTGTGAL